MRDHDQSIFIRLYPGEELDDGAECVDIKSTLDLVEEDIARSEEFHLEDLRFALLPSRESHIKIPIEKRLGDGELREVREYESAEHEGRERLGSLGEILVVDRAKILRESHSFDLGDGLQGQKYPFFVAFIGRECGDILSVEHKRSGIEAILRMTHDGERERGLTTPVLPEEEVGLPELEAAIYIFEDLFFFYGNGEILDLEHGFIYTQI